MVSGGVGLLAEHLVHRGGILGRGGRTEVAEAVRPTLRHEEPRVRREALRTVFALAGDLVNIGLIEVPMGTTLRHIVEDIGGGIPDGKSFKAAQTGGPSGGCIPADHLDTPVDYDSLKVTLEHKFGVEVVLGTHSY